MAAPTTIVLITHEMQVIRTICDRVAVIDGGRIVEAGRVADVFLQLPLAVAGATPTPTAGPAFSLLAAIAALARFQELMQVNHADTADQGNTVRVVVDLYGQHLSVAFIDYLRPEMKFDGLPALMAQMDADCDRARTILAAL